MPNRETDAEAALGEGQGEKTCRECSSKIPDSARKCTHCNAFQDWRRFLSVGNSSLSLVVALIAVLSIAVPVIGDSIVPKYERVSARVVTQMTDDRLGGKVLVVLVSNAGTAPAFIEPNANLSVTGTRLGHPVDLNPCAKPESDLPCIEYTPVSNLLIEPASQRVLLSGPRDEFPDVADPDDSPNAKCELSIKVHQVDGGKRTEKHAYTCFDWNTDYRISN